MAHLAEHTDMIKRVGDKAWNQWNHGTSAKPWNECRKTAEVPREIGVLIPSTSYTHPTANRVPGNFNEHVGYTTGTLCAAVWQVVA
jgi:hypothetical protein